MSNHVTYIKLSPYLATYWRKAMLLKPDAPLELTALETRMYILPFLKENVDLYRSPSKNDRGYFKDANSYCEHAYKMAMISAPDIVPDPDKKIPTHAECAKLAPILLPPRAFINRRDKGNRAVRQEVATNEFFELKDSGVTAIRNCIHDYFYAELHTYVLREQRRLARLGKLCNVSTTIESFLLTNGIIEDDDYLATKEHVRKRLYEYNEKNYRSCDPDSIRRAYNTDIKKRRLTNNLQSAQKK